jgi:hypothetical protein
MEFTNKTLVWFVLAAIVVSLTGTIITLNGVNENGFSGFASSNRTGNATVSISSQTSLNFVVNALDFGTGSVNSTTPYSCVLSNFNSTNITRVGNCDGFNSSTVANGWLQIENIGNTRMNVTLNFSANASTFIGGGTGANAPAPQLLFKAGDNESGSCGADVNATTAAWTNVTGAAGERFPICMGSTGLLSVPATNSMSIGINITIPYDAVGSKAIIIQASGEN